MSKEQQVRNAGIYMVPTVISMILPIISLPIILDYLSPAEFGAYTLSFAFGSVVVGFCQLSLLGVYERNFFLYNESKQRAQLLFTDRTTQLLVENHKKWKRDRQSVSYYTDDVTDKMNIVITEKRNADEENKDKR